MRNSITTPTISEILVDEFMTPLGISANRLANEINVPVSRIWDIVNGKRKITADTSLRLGKFFGVSGNYFLKMQVDIDIRNEREKIGKDIDSIVPFEMLA